MPLPQQFYQANVVYRISRLYSYAGPVLPVLPKSLLRTYRRAPFTVEGAINGMGMIEGTVTIQGAPAKSRVVALSGRGLRPYVDVYSDPVTGEFRIYPLPRNSRYVVLTRDARQRFDAVIHDGIEPVDWEEEQ